MVVVAKDGTRGAVAPAPTLRCASINYLTPFGAYPQGAFDFTIGPTVLPVVLDDYDRLYIEFWINPSVGVFNSALFFGELYVRFNGVTVSHTSNNAVYGSSGGIWVTSQMITSDFRTFSQSGNLAALRYSGVWIWDQPQPADSFNFLLTLFRRPTF